MDMRAWQREQIAVPKKKAIPVLTFPSVQLLGITVRELISDADTQAEGMARISERCDTAAALSMMDLSVEAEAFGSEIRVGDHEVPTVVGHIVDEPEDAEKLAVPSVGAGRTGLYLDAIVKAPDQIASLGAMGYHFGNSIRLREMLTAMPADVMVCGNVDPAGAFCNGTPEKVRSDTLAVLNDCCEFPNFIPSSGCDIPPTTPWENIDEFFRTVAQFYQDR